MYDHSHRLTVGVRSSLFFVPRPTLIGKQHSSYWSQTCLPAPLFAVGQWKQHMNAHSIVYVKLKAYPTVVLY